MGRGVWTTGLCRLRWYVPYATAAWHSILTSQLPFTALTAACIGGAYNGIGIHKERLDTEQTKTGMQVRSADSSSLTSCGY